MQAFLCARLGTYRVARFCGWDHAASNVWEVVSGGRRFYLKHHKQPRKFRQEAYAYRAWTPHLNATPDLVATHEGPNALLLSAVPGVLAQDAALSDAQGRAAYRRAGAFLRRLHDLPFDDTDALPLADAMTKRGEAWIARATGTLEPPVIDWVWAQLAEAAEVVGERGWTRVPCHRDYTARNWLVDSGDFYVIDFEHARPDLWFADIERLWSGVWQRRPDLMAAFFGGYGRTLTPEEEGALRGLAAHAALTTIVWAKEHGDHAFERHGREVLTRLKRA